jgi:hypothetical protein
MDDDRIARLLMLGRLGTVQKMALRREVNFRLRHGRKSNGRRERDQLGTAPALKQTEPETLIYTSKLLEIIDSWERHQLRLNHPDRNGGNDVGFKAVQQTIEALRSVIDGSDR